MREDSKNVEVRNQERGHHMHFTKILIVLGLSLAIGLLVVQRSGR